MNMITVLGKLKSINYVFLKFGFYLVMVIILAGPEFNQNIA